jgi:hypothetical protein
MGGVDGMNRHQYNRCCLLSVGDFLDRFLYLLLREHVGLLLAIGPIAVCLQIKAEPLYPISELY